MASTNFQLLFVAVLCSFNIVSSDIQPPVVDYCPSDIREFSYSRFMNITWRAPSFHDPHGHHLDVTTNYPINGFTFSWGDYTAIYTALNPYNGLQSICTFNISVRPIPCPDLNVTINGALVCNGWITEYFRLCIIFCRRGTKLQRGHYFQTKYFCAESRWLPSRTLPYCGRLNGSALRSFDNFFYYFRRCDDEEKDNMREKYLDVLKKSLFNELCDTYADLCKKENVDVQC